MAIVRRFITIIAVMLHLHYGFTVTAQTISYQ